MSERICYFLSGDDTTSIALPFDLDSVISDWSGLRSIMYKEMPPEFTRDEWAYLISFLEKENLIQPFDISFGHLIETPEKPSGSAFRPRGEVALWLPNNVTLLGPLMVVLLSLTGNSISIKSGTRGEDLTGAFLEFAINNLPDGELKESLRDKVHAAVFDRNDPRNSEMANRAQVRIIFGSNESAQTVHSLPHPENSIGFSFVDRRSEAWLEKDAITEKTLSILIKVFAIYGNTGCTSPHRVILLDSSRDDALTLRDNLISLWPSVIRNDPPANIASSNVLALQISRALGWNSMLTERNRAVLTSGSYSLKEFPGPMALPIITSTLDEVVINLPRNIQTVGYALVNPEDEKWARAVKAGSVLRFVPISTMHHFGPVWDDQEFWRQTFEETGADP
jgi:hypothetical protein